MGITKALLRNNNYQWKPMHFNPDNGKNSPRIKKSIGDSLKGETWFMPVHAFIHEKNLSREFKKHNLYMNYAVTDDTKVTGFMFEGLYIDVNKFY